MVSITHLNGADVIVIDAHGRTVPAVNEVRVEYDRAAVAVQQGARGWLDALRSSGLEEAPRAMVIDSRDGRVHWSGPIRVAYA